MPVAKEEKQDKKNDDDRKSARKRVQERDERTMTREVIYLDNHATTPLDPRVFEAMKPYLTEHYGNASSSTHPFGWKAAHAVDHARKEVARLIGALPKEIFFTSGATESNNLALLGFPFSHSNPHMITTAVEHKSVLKTAQALSKRGVEVTFLPVDPDGCVDVEKVANALRPGTELISIIFANNEIGSINPIKEIGALAKMKKIAFHTDAAQASGKIPIDVNEMSIDLLSISAHKIYGPKGCGALYVRQKDPRIRLNPIMFGGSQEQDLRPGTLNVPGIVGLGEACSLAETEMSKECERLTLYRDQILNGLSREIPGLKINGSLIHRLSNNVNISIPEISPDLLFEGLRDVAYSSGAACLSSSGETSHVLRAIGLSERLARTTLRLGLGRFTTEAEVQRTLELIVKTAKSVRHESAHFAPL